MREIPLVVMAAGMGSRYGGLKQIDPIGKNGEIIIDYSIYDAIKAGFNKVVFIIKKEIEEDFRDIAGKRMEKLIDVGYAFQTMENMPPDRTKPWGTAHAILCAESTINTPFAVINADDFYGASAYKALGDYLRTGTDYSMVGYLLENTLTENGTVARGVCDVENGYLKTVTEHLSIPFDNDFPKSTIASMNMFGFQPNLFGYLKEEFAKFMKDYGHELKSEFLIPRVVDDLIKSGREKVKVLNSTDKWYGVTYREDLEGVQTAVADVVAAGIYDGM